MSFKNLVISFGGVGLGIGIIFLIATFGADTLTNYIKTNNLTFAETMELHIMLITGFMLLAVFLSLSIAYYQMLERKGK